MTRTANVSTAATVAPAAAVAPLDRIDAGSWRGMLAAFASSLHQQHGLLTDLDCASGDGDHGTTMLRGAERIKAVLANASHTTAESLLDAAAWEFIGVDGGASGPLVGMIFLGIADSCKGFATLDAAALGSALDSGVKMLRTRTKAEPGDKTMLDALLPAVEAFQTKAAATHDVAASMQQAAAAAEAGAHATRNMVARFGRAKNLGDRTLGHQDPGSTTISILFNAFAHALSKEALSRQTAGNGAATL